MIALLWLCLIALAAPALADERFTASVDHNTVRVGEMVTLTLEFSGAAGGVGTPTFPALDKLQLAGGPYTSTNFSLVNGKASSTTSYAYSLVAREAGTGKIGEAVVRYKGKEYRSNPISVNILTAGAAAPTTSGGGKGNESGDVFIRLYPDKTDAYLGEQITVTYKIFFAVQISNLQPEKSPGTTGFWVEEYPLPQQLTVNREVLNGKAYNVAVFKKIALFPTSVGTLELDPMVISTQMQRATRQRSRDPFDLFSDPFFGMGAPLQQVQIQSPSLKINVRPLPQTGAPASFAGAVGAYKLQATLDRNNCKTGDAVTLTVTIAGNGNVKTLPEPIIHFPADVDHYDPEISDDIHRNQPQINGTKTFKYVVIPRAPGSQVIPAISYAFFDPEESRFESAASPELRLQVEQGEGSVAAGGRSVAEKRKVESVSTDIAFVKTDPGHFYDVGEVPHNTLEFWGFSVAPWAALAAGVVVARKRQGLAAGRRGALTKAQKQLDHAEKALKAGKKELVLHHVAASMDTLLSGTIGMDVAELTSEHLAERWEAEQLDPELLRNILDVESECDRARFAAGVGASDSLNDLIARTHSIVDRLGRAQMKEGAQV